MEEDFAPGGRGAHLLERSTVKSTLETSPLWKKDCVGAVSNNPSEISLHAFAEFWDQYSALPVDIQEQASKQFALGEANAYHPALLLKIPG